MARIGEMTGQISFKSIADIPSGPELLFGGKFVINLDTLSLYLYKFTIACSLLIKLEIMSNSGLIGWKIRIRIFLHTRQKR